MKIIGHRGARRLAPENTIAGLKKAEGYHVDELEFDVRVTKDSVVVLQHNAYVRDASGRRRAIGKHTYKQLVSYKPDLATLTEVFEVLDQGTRLYIEVKPRVVLAPIVAMVQKQLVQGWASETLLLASKSQKTLLQLHQALPDIQKIVIEPWSGIRAVYRARQVQTKRLSMNQLWLWRGFIAPMARRGWQLSAYPLNNPHKAKRWARYGLYGVITDYPDRFKE